MKYTLISALMLVCVGCSGGPPKPPIHVGGPPMPDTLGVWSQPSPIEEEDTALEASPPRQLPAMPHEKVMPYETGREVEVAVMVGKPFRITLQEGEKVYNVVDGFRGVLPEGDEHPPWQVTESYSGPSKQPHIVVTAHQPGLTNGLTITTSERVYDIALRSVAASKIRTLRWNYPTTPLARPVKPRILPLEPRSYDAGYRWETSDPEPIWTPRQVVDTGRQTFIILPPNLASMQAPMIRLLGPNGPELVNARQYRNIMILDHRFNAAELGYGTGDHAELVKIIREPSRPIHCPALNQSTRRPPECPVWPTTLAMVGR